MVKSDADRRRSLAVASGVIPTSATDAQTLGVAELVIRTMNVMGDVDRGPRSTHVIYETISALRQIGLINDARQLAVESLISAGL